MKKKPKLEVLLRAVRDEQPGAWKRLAPALARRLGAYFGPIFSEADANDLTQTTMEAIVRKLPSLELKKSLTAWVIGIARHKAIDRLRKCYSEEACLALLAQVDPKYSPSPDSRLSKQEWLDLLREEVENMPSHHRRTIEIQMEDRSLKTHARRENISVTAAAVRRHRALNWLRKRFEARQQPASPNVVSASSATSTPG